MGAEETDITLPKTLDVTLELRSGESGVEAAAAVQEPETQTEPEIQEPVPDNMQTEENTGTQGDPDVTQEQTDGPETDQGTENGTEPVMPSETENTEQTETPGTEEPGTQQTEAPVTEAPVQQQAEPAEPSGQEGQSAGAEAPAAETGAAETAAVLQAEPPAEPETPVTEGQKAPETAGMEQTVTDTSSDGGILTSLLDAVFPSMTVHAAETDSQTVTSINITWKIDDTRSDSETFQSEKAAKYVYVPELPETVTINGIDYTLELGEGVQLPEITVTVAEKTDGYGTIIHEGTTGNCTWRLYDTDGDRTEDLLVIGGTGAMPDYSSLADRPWNDYWENIKKVVVEEGITALGNSAFRSCSNLEEAALPSTLGKIGTSAFYSCTSLDTLVIPSGLTEIGENSFGNCSSLKFITLPDTLKNIGEYAFYCCGLVEIVIPEGVETIGDRAFCQCKSLQSVILPDTLISIGEDAFYHDSDLTIIVPEGVQTIGNDAFSKAKAVYNLSDCAVTGSNISKKVNCDKITLIENGKSSEQRVLPADCVAGSRYENTRYDASYYYSSGEGNTAWYVQNGDTYEKVTSGTSFQNTPTFYYAKAFNDRAVAAEASGESGDTYTLVVKDKETGKKLEEGTHYTQEMTDSTDWAETDTGSLAKTVTVTITGIAGGGYAGTMQTTFQISAEAEASVTADGSTKKYLAFEDAWEAAQGNTAVVTLLADVEVSATLTVTSGSNITLKSETDSNYTISGKVFNASSGLINIASGGTFTLVSGIVRNGEKGNNAIAVNGGHFVLNGGTAAATADGHSGVCVYNSGTAEIRTGNVSGDIGVAAASDGSTITILDGNISGRASGVYVSGTGAKITITGGSISASNTKEKNGEDGAALRIQETGSALLYGGTYSGAYGIFINNGNSITLKELLDVSRDVKYAYYSNGVLVTEGLDGKTLTGSLTVGECGHSYKTWTDKKDGENHSGTCVVCGHEETKPHDWDTDGSCKAEGCTAQAVASVTGNDGKTAYYPTIEEAWQAAKNMTGTATVTLLADAVVTSSLTVEDNEEIIFTGKSADGAVHTLSSDMLYYQGVIAVNGGSLLLLDGNIRACSGGYGLNVKGGSFIMKDGSIVGTYWALVAEAGSVTIDGGTINAGIGYGLMVYKDAPVTVTLSGGTYIGGNGGNYAVGGSGSVGNYLANGYAYKQGGTWVNDTTVTELTGTVTVEKAPIQSVNISPDVTTTITYGDTAPTLTATATQPDGSTNDVTYQWYLAGEEIVGATGETYTPDKLDAGEYAYTCTATVDGYSLPGTAATVKVEQRELELVFVGETTKTYDETVDAPAGLSIEIRNIVSRDDVTVTVESYTYNSANVKEAKTITANGVTLSGADADNYKLPEESVTIDGTITKFQPTITFKDPSIVSQYGQVYTDAGLKLTLNINGASEDDVVFTWTDSEQKPLSAAPTNSGTYTLTATIPATDNKELATASTTVSIEPKPLSRPTITLDPDRYEYDGTAKEPDVKVFDGDTEIDSDEYTVTYSNNVEVGTATVTITNNEGGNYEIDESATTFEITKPDLATATVTLKQDSFIYDGTGHRPTVTVVKNGNTLTEGTDYTVTYEKNVDAGTASATITAVENGNYYGTQTVEFKIEKATPNLGTVGYNGTIYPDTALADIVLTRTDETVPGTLALKEGQTLTAGTGAYDWTFIPQDTDNYNEVTGTVTLEVVIDPDATAYTITIPKIAVAGGDAVSVGINTKEPFNLNGGTVSVSVSDGIDENGKLTLTNTDGSGSSVTSVMYVGEEPITAFTDKVFATFTSVEDPSVSLSFKKPTETDILAGTYEGTVTFSIDYTAEGGTSE